MSGFQQYETEVLVKIHQNLLNGLTEVAKTLENGTFHVVREKGASPPSQSGQLTLVLLRAVVLELKSRGYHPDNQRSEP